MSDGVSEPFTQKDLGNAAGDFPTTTCNVSDPFTGWKNLYVTKNEMKIITLSKQESEDREEDECRARRRRDVQGGNGNGAPGEWTADVAGTKRACLTSVQVPEENNFLNGSLP